MFVHCKLAYLIHSWPEGPWLACIFAFSHLQSLYVRLPATYIRCNNRLHHRLIYSKHRHCLLEPPSFCTGKNIHLYLKRGMGLVSLISIVAFYLNNQKKNKENQQQQTKQCSLFFWAQKLGVVYTKKRTRDIWQYTTWFKLKLGFVPLVISMHVGDIDSRGVGTSTKSHTSP